MADATLTPVYEMLLQQLRALRDVKLQVETLKRMMFEHRPAFEPTFAELLERVSQSESVQGLDRGIARLETALRGLQRE
jgi:hypothetical protein